MWLYILLALGLVFIAVMGVVSGGIVSIIAIPLALLVGAFIVMRMMASGRETPQLVSTSREPSGTTRTASSGPATANERVGRA